MNLGPSVSVWPGASPEGRPPFVTPAAAGRLRRSRAAAGAIAGRCGRPAGIAPIHLAPVVPLVPPPGPGGAAATAAAGTGSAAERTSRAAATFYETTRSGRRSAAARVAAGPARQRLIPGWVWPRSPWRSSVWRSSSTGRTAPAGGSAGSDPAGDPREHDARADLGRGPADAWFDPGADPVASPTGVVAGETDVPTIRLVRRHDIADRHGHADARPPADPAQPGSQDRRHDPTPTRGRRRRPRRRLTAPTDPTPTPTPTRPDAAPDPDAHRPDADP